jgi:hypothetical protein
LSAIYGEQVLAFRRTHHQERSAVVALVVLICDHTAENFSD